MFDYFPKPTTTTIPLFGDLFVVVKSRLTVGEERRARKRMYVYDKAEDAIRVDPTMGKLSTVLAYLLDWNVPRDGTVVDIRALAIEAARDDGKVADLQRVVESIDPVVYDAIEEAILAHEAAADAARIAEKKTMTARATSTSSSPSAPDGPSSTSETSTPTISTPSSESSSALVGA